MPRPKKKVTLDTPHNLRLTEATEKEYLYYQAMEYRLKGGEVPAKTKLTRELIHEWIESKRELYDDEYRRNHQAIPKAREAKAS